MSIDTNVAARSPRVADTANAFLTPATGALVLTAIAIVSVIFVQLGILPWTLSEVDAGAIGSLLTN